MSSDAHRPLASRGVGAGDLGWLLGALATVFAGLWLTGWRLSVILISWSDARAYFVPKYQYAAERMAAGHLPLWNPLEFGGIPLLATFQAAVLYPPARLVTAVLAGPMAHPALVVLHILIATFGTLWLARDLGLGRPAAILAALWVTQPNWLVRAFDNAGTLAGAAWIPYLVVLTRRAIHVPSTRTAGLLGVVWALQMTSGYPPMVLATAYIVVLGLPLWMLEEPGVTARQVARGLGTLASGAAVALLLASLQIVPAVELVLETNRSVAATAMRDVLPNLDPQAASLLDIPQRDVLHAFLEAWHRWGPVPLVLGIAGLLCAPRRPAAWFGLLGVTLAMLLPIAVYSYLPFYRFVRTFAEWCHVAPLVLFLWAAIGWDAVLARVRVSGAGSIIATAAVVVLATSWNWWHTPATLPANLSETPPVPPWVTRECALADSTYRAYWPRTQRDGTLFAARVASVGGYEPLLPARAEWLAGTLGVGNGPTVPSWAKQLTAARTVAARAALRCVIDPAPHALEGAGLRAVEGPDHVRVYVDSTALARAHLASDVQWAVSPEAAARLARELPATTTVLEGVAPPPTAACAPGGSDVARVVSEAPEDVRIAVTTSCPTYLVLADSWFPGWIAAVDGVSTPILRADYAFRAVAVSPGRHDVRFVYAPCSVRIGAGLSAVGAVVVLALLAHSPQRGRFA